MWRKSRVWSCLVLCACVTSLLADSERPGGKDGVDIGKAVEGRQDGVDEDYEMAMRLALHSLKSHPSREHAEDFAGFGNFPSKEESPLWQQREELVSDMMLEDAVYEGGEEEVVQKVKSEDSDHEGHSLPLTPDSQDTLYNDKTATAEDPTADKGKSPVISTTLNLNRNRAGWLMPDETMPE